MSIDFEKLRKREKKGNASGRMLFNEINYRRVVLKSVRMVSASRLSYCEDSAAALFIIALKYCAVLGIRNDLIGVTVNKHNGDFMLQK